MDKIIQTAKKLTPSASYAAADALRKSGHLYPISFAIGGIDIEGESYSTEKVYEQLKAKINKRIDNEDYFGLNKTEDSQGNLALRQLYCDVKKSEHTASDNLEISPENIVIVPGGGKGGLATILSALLLRDEDTPPAKVALIRPAWCSYTSVIQAAGAKPVFYNSKAANNYKITPNELRAFLEESGAEVYLHQRLSNPKGVAYTKAVMTAPHNVAKKVASYIRDTSSFVSVPVQIMLNVALNHKLEGNYSREHITLPRQKLREAAEFFKGSLLELEIPEHGYFLTLHFDKKLFLNGEAASKYLISKKGVAVVEGEAFDGGYSEKPWIRLALGAVTQSELKNGCERITAAFKERMEEIAQQTILRFWQEKVRKTRRKMVPAGGLELPT